MPGGSRASQHESSLASDQLTEPTLGHVRALNEIAAARGQSLAQLALAWALRDQRVTSVLIGASSVAQLEENLAAAGHPAFTADELAAIDRDAVEAGDQHLGRVQRPLTPPDPAPPRPDGARPNAMRPDIHGVRTP